MQPGQSTSEPALDVAALAAVASPVERARLVCEYARRVGTLPAALANLRRAALVEARNEGRKVSWIAAQVGLTPSRVSQITAEAAERAAASAQK